MANNTTIDVLTGDDGVSSLWFYIVYFIQGGIVAASNFLIVCTVARHKALRTSKEYVLMMGLSLVDACNMSGYCIAGLYRSMLVLKGLHSSYVTAWHCMTTIHNLTWSFAEHLSGLILFIVSVDRLLLVSVPCKYYTWTRKYVISMISAAFVYTLVTGTITYMALVLWVDDHTPLPSMCFSGAALVGLPCAYQIYYQYACPSFAFLSIVIFGMVGVLYWKRQKKTSPTGNSTQINQNKQKRFTITLGISTLCTLFVFMIPYTIGYIGYNRGAPTYFVMLMFIISNCNPLCNVFIYSMRHQEMKQGIQALIMGKTMPANLDVWKRNRNATCANHVTRYRRKTKVVPRDVIELKQFQPWKASKKDRNTVLAGQPCPLGQTRLPDCDFDGPGLGQAPISRELRYDGLDKLPGFI